MKAHEKELWEFANELRHGRDRLAPRAALELAAEREVEITHRDAHLLGWLFGPGGPALVPTFIADFICAALDEADVATILDPWAGTGAVADLVSVAKKPQRTVAIVPTHEEMEIAEFLSQHKATERKLGDPLTLLGEVDGAFDVALILGPLGSSRRTKITYGDFELREGRAAHIVMQACERLEENGQAFCLLPPSFFFRSSRPELCQALRACGFALDAAFYLPPGTFAPATSIPAYLVIVRRGEQGNLFVAELTPSSPVEQLLANWRSRSPGTSLGLGSIHDVQNFRSYPDLESDLRIRALVADSNLRSVRLADVAVAINRYSRTHDDGFEERSNAVYLPRLGTADAVTRLSDLKLNPQNYLQIVFDEERVLAEWAAHFFNCDIGLEVRQRLCSGATISSISLELLREAEIFTSPLELQAKQVRLVDLIRQEHTDLDELEGRLWRSPAGVADVASKLASRERVAGLEGWVSHLPFPLASILRRFIARGGARQKKEHLLHFFEALGEFLAALVLSAVKRDSGFRNDHQERLFGDISADAIRRPSFGLWCTLFGRLAKSVRTELSSGDSDQRERVREMFCLPVQIVERLVSKKVLAVLEKASAYRNTWHGHTGVESEKLASDRVASLESELQQARSALGGVFERLQLVQPMSASYSRGVYDNQVRFLTGSDTAFVEGGLRTTIPLDFDYLYLCDRDTPLPDKPLQLVPLIRMGAPPATAQTACYFWNRVDRQGVRWISYHHEDTAEYLEADTLEVEELFRALVAGEPTD